jgi:predicted Zn-dependent peptidase
MLAGSNLVIGAVGDFDREQVIAGLAGLSALPRGAPIDLEADPPVLGEGEPVLAATTRSQATVVLAFRGAGTEAADERVALDLFDAYASGRRIPSGPLFEALRGEDDLVYHVSASHRPHPGSGLFFILAQCSPENYPSVLATLEETVTTLAASDMQQEDLDTARNILLASRQTTHQTAAVRARMLAVAGNYGLPVDSEHAYRQRVGEAGLQRVNQAVRHMLKGERLLLLIWPEGIERP